MSTGIGGDAKIRGTSLGPCGGIGWGVEAVHAPQLVWGLGCRVWGLGFRNRVERLEAVHSPQPSALSPQPSYLIPRIPNPKPPKPPNQVDGAECSIEACEVEGTWGGVRAAKGAMITVDATSFSRQRGTGLGCESEGLITSSHCSLLGGAGGGIEVEGGGSLRVEETKISTYGQDGASVKDEGSSLVVDGCDIMQCARNGVWVRSGGRAQVRGGRILLNKATGVVCEGASSSLRCDGTIIQSNHKDGVHALVGGSIALRGPGASKGVVDGDGGAGGVVRMNAGLGIRASGTGGMVELVELGVGGNERGGCGAYDGGRIEARLCRIEGNRGDGVMCSGEGSTILVSSSDLSMNAGAGGRADAGGRLVLQRCRFGDNSGGDAASDIDSEIVQTDERRPSEHGRPASHGGGSGGGADKSVRGRGDQGVSLPAIERQGQSGKAQRPTTPNRHVGERPTTPNRHVGERPTTPMKRPPTPSSKGRPSTPSSRGRPSTPLPTSGRPSQGAGPGTDGIKAREERVVFAPSRP